MSLSDAVAWFEIHVNDIGRMRTFYTEVFGWTYEEIPEFPLGAYSMIVTGAGGPPVGGLAQSARRTPPTGESTVVYLLVDDIDGTLDAVLKAAARWTGRRWTSAGTTATALSSATRKATTWASGLSR
ncbi:VOC family protein [Nonomuraea ferruginea]